MGSETNCGQMVRGMKVSGETIRRTVKANLCMRMVTYMKENGLTTKLKAKGHIAMQMVLITRVLG